MDRTPRRDEPGERYDRQRRVRGSGAPADDRLAELRVLLVGVGGTGTPIAEGLTRAGVGTLVLLDPDSVAPSNLARQTLFTASDAALGLPKVDAALAALVPIGGRTELSGRAVALTSRNADEWIGTVDLVIDATDHLPVRSVIDRSCRALDRPWIHTAAIEDRFTVVPFLSPGPPCFRCYVPDFPPAAAVGTCESRGVLPPAPQLAAAHALSALWGWISRPKDTPRGTRTVVRGRVGVPGTTTVVLRPDPECPECGSGRRGAADTATVVRPLCGQDRVEAWTDLGAEEAERRLVTVGGGWSQETRAGILRARNGAERLTLFPDGRVLHGPGRDPEAARHRLEELLGDNALAGPDRV